MENDTRVSVRSARSEWETEQDVIDNVSEENLQRLRLVWKRFDTKRDGKITMSEMTQALQLLGMNPSEVEVQSYVTLLDRNNDGQIDFLEFARAWWEREVSQDQADMMLELDLAFQVLDRDGSGVISATELRELLTTVGEKMTDVEVDELLAEADTDRSGTISLAEFKELPCWWR